MQPNGWRGKGWGLLRVRQDDPAACQPGWHVQLRHDGNACSQRECARGQLRARRVHGRLRGHLPAARRAASATAHATDVRVHLDTRGWWQRHQRFQHLHRPSGTDAAAATTAYGPASPAIPASADVAAVAACTAGWLLTAASGAAASIAECTAAALAAVSAAASPRAILTVAAAALAAGTAGPASAAAAACTARRLLASAACCPAVPAAASIGTALALAAPTVAAVGAAAVLPHCAGGKHGLR